MKRLVVTALLLGCLAAPACAEREIAVSDDDAQWIGCKIFFNECSGRVDKLISWNEGEDFLSLGIGHFIWYARDKRGPYQERFPAFLRFAAEHRADVPEWLAGAEPCCPWSSRDEYLRKCRSKKAWELQAFLAGTVSEQLLFIIKRIEGLGPKLIAAASEATRAHVEKQFYRLADTPAGLYALIDYVNFKGEGISPDERYNGQGWGLLQALERMTGADPGAAAVREFAEAADALLTERVANAPPERREERWLCGWKARVASYIAASAECP